VPVHLLIGKDIAAKALKHNPFYFLELTVEELGLLAPALAFRWRISKRTEVKDVPSTSNGEEARDRVLRGIRSEKMCPNSTLLYACKRAHSRYNRRQRKRDERHDPVAMPECIDEKSTCTELRHSPARARMSTPLRMQSHNLWQQVRALQRGTRELRRKCQSIVGVEGVEHSQKVQLSKEWH